MSDTPSEEDTVSPTSQEGISRLPSPDGTIILTNEEHTTFPISEVTTTDLVNSGEYLQRDYNNKLPRK